jgi:hypothetical protein
MMTGLSIVPLNPPIAIADGTTTKFLTLSNLLVADGWVVLMVSFNEFALLHGASGSAAGNSAQYIQNDISNDAGNGARLLAGNLHWWDHVFQFIYKTYGHWPIVPLGVSWGGWHSYIAAINRTAQIIAYASMCGVSILSHVATAATGTANWTALTTTGADITSSALNGVSIPGWIGYSSTDTVVGTTDPAALYNAAHTAGAPVTNLSDTTNGHGLFGTDIGPGGSGFTGTTIMDWFTATVDPLAPKVL